MTEYDAMTLHNEEEMEHPVQIMRLQHLKSSKPQKRKVLKGMEPVPAHCFYSAAGHDSTQCTAGAKVVVGQFTNKPCSTSSTKTQLYRAVRDPTER